MRLAAVDSGDDWLAAAPRDIYQALCATVQPITSRLVWVRVEDGRHLVLGGDHVNTLAVGTIYVSDCFHYVSKTSPETVRKQSETLFPKSFQHLGH